MYMTLDFKFRWVPDLMQIVRMICELCDALSNRSHDEIALLCERARSISRDSVDVVIESSRQIQPSLNREYQEAHASLSDSSCIGNFTRQYRSQMTQLIFFSSLDPCLLSNCQEDQYRASLAPFAETYEARKERGCPITSSIVPCEDRQFNEFDGALQEIANMDTRRLCNNSISEDQISPGSVHTSLPAISESRRIQGIRSVSEEQQEHPAVQGEVVRFRPGLERECMDEDAAVQSEEQVQTTYSKNFESTHHVEASPYTSSPSQRHFGASTDPNLLDIPTSQGKYLEVLETGSAGHLRADDRAEGFPYRRLRELESPPYTGDARNGFIHEDGEDGEDGMLSMTYADDDRMLPRLTTNWHEAEHSHENHATIPGSRPIGCNREPQKSPVF